VVEGGRVKSLVKPLDWWEMMTPEELEEFKRIGDLKILHDEHGHNWPKAAMAHQRRIVYNNRKRVQRKI
jgi:hypothetical protein